ncbi:hypothetical protein UNSWDHB_1706 [Dehalobacter sp. UNSWDHB]|uniref:DUF6544 family protein n=1 Tax=unclassified Dehalobacter TaxID=2635733 RepID=UPI00028B3F73|nr:MULTISPECIES: DUF6544 family protein [unclassified Dehalobacter]AFV03551.1 hypothetical protein DHBDCA_p2524 [Dehalobacter sp. DCA]AFV06536.1 hypothetical protein DCF50_p2533 [Dehalobacter sp. CF]EQB20987.1 hypothetical protein UNSWDHB_1706 [Dehalobacter sp. UNSWDHB]
MITLGVVTGILAAIILLAVIYFIQPYSSLKSDFNKTAAQLISETQPETEMFSQQDIADLPEPVQKYFNHCGYIGTSKMSWMKTEFKDVPFSTGVDKATLTIDYTQYNFVETPNRLAFIDSAMYGIPFQGFDSYNQGVGSMKGVIAKAFTLFDQKGVEMDEACLATVLAESLYVPNIALQGYITWEAIDDTHAKASITSFGISASGIFTFNETGEMLEFTTNDRMAVGFDGSKQSIPWSAVYEGYERNENGIFKPTILKAVWHYPEGDLVYFNGKILSSTTYLH